VIVVVAEIITELMVYEETNHTNHYNNYAFNRRFRAGSPGMAKFDEEIIMTLNTEQRNAFIMAFWDNLNTPKGYRKQKQFLNERRETGHGVKSPEGFLALIEDCLNNPIGKLETNGRE
jgi:hypothetical protein